MPIHREDQKELSYILDEILESMRKNNDSSNESEKRLIEEDEIIKNLIIEIQEEEYATKK